ncbi:MAG: spermidine synthase [Allosphingosinicella sp.]|uniref:spermidine synthase n=1 Tax=Allosphingosinicella sp. TaxID=2823234 RepID=UPI00395E609D
MFEELDYRPSPIGALSLRRRRRSAEGEDIWEIKLDEGYLMSSLFTEGEIALARIALGSLDDRPLDVVVGGLGLGYTAKAVLDHANVASLIVVDAIPEVIEWHRRHLLPLGKELAEDPRCRLVCGNFFEMAARAGELDPEAAGRRFDAILVDIDNSPRSLLHPDNAVFYEVDGLAELADKLADGGVFGLWSTDSPDDEFIARLQTVFGSVESHVVAFENPYQGSPALNTVYVAHKAGG